ncbi:putative RNA-directed DNA polymerase from transposon BS [Trichonephila clavipes]|nr:putative RNA-directed DNA polymerase from transposon BS [Trichonephila clavipes]
MSRLTFNKADKHTERHAKLAIHNCRRSDLGDPVFLADFSLHELLLALNAFDSKMSPGPDNIHGVMITHLVPSCTQRLLDIFNQSWKSVADCLTSGKEPISPLGIRARVIRVKYNKTLSKDFKHNQGVPQGSVLSPTLFSIFLAEVEKLITDNSSIGLFADDIVLWHSSHDLPSIKANFSQCLSTGADASTLKITYTTLIRPVLEFGFAIFFNASDSNLKKLERIQLTAAGIIVVLRNSCPNNLVLYECDLQPLDMRKNYCLTKYFNKLLSYGDQLRTSQYLKHSKDNQRLKQNSPFSQALAQNLSFNVKHLCLTSFINPVFELQFIPI